MNSDTRRSGVALLATVALLTVIVGVLAASYAMSSGSRALSARRQLFLEQALFVAEAGAEMAVNYLGSSKRPTVPVTLTNNVGDGSYRAYVWQATNIGSSSRSYMIASTGTVKGVSRGILIEGATQKTWARYALWSDDNRNIYFKSGEKFRGPVHANTHLWFSGDPEFFDDVSSSKTTVQGNTNACIFHDGIMLGVKSNTLWEVDFTDMLSVAKMVITGATTIVFQGTNMMVSNTQRGWTNRVMNVPSNGLIYVALTGTTNGDVRVRGVLDGRVTVVGERDVLVVSNLTYAVDPATNSASDDALGLISGRDVVVTTNFPNSGKIYAHIIAGGTKTQQASDGSFGVQNYDTRAPSGQLTVYGGIAQTWRGAVGTFSGTTLTSGFDKNYTYDERFKIDPPPEYPPVSALFRWDKWRIGR